MNDNCQLLNNNTDGNYTLWMGFDPNNTMQSIAAFLITRPLYAWIGYGWESDMRNWEEAFLWNVGEPRENVCNQIGNGVYQREWTYGNVSLDCNKWEANVPHK